MPNSVTAATPFRASPGAERSTTGHGGGHTARWPPQQWASGSPPVWWHRWSGSERPPALASPDAIRGPSHDAELLHGTLLGTARLHIVHFLSRRSTFVARTLVQQSRSLDGLISVIDEFLARHPSQRASDTAFERDCLAYVARKHGRLTLYGIDLANSPHRWPLDAAYMSLDTTTSGAHEGAALGAFGDDDLHPVGSSAPVPADQAPAGRDRILLRGIAGSGKSPLVQWLAVSCTKAPALTPLPTSTAASPSSSRCAPSPATARPYPPRTASWRPSAAPSPGRSPAAGPTGSWPPGGRSSSSTARTRSPTANASRPGAGCAIRSTPSRTTGGWSPPAPPPYATTGPPPTASTS